LSFVSLPLTQGVVLLGESLYGYVTGCITLTLELRWE